ncbi:transcription factor bHLH144 [Apium graveolens]|uniref:transcription factor bHLH144 n=1 Tax=Apium graveolens TaxID=4045 RepID=UPI003D7BB593
MHREQPCTPQKPKVYHTDQLGRGFMCRAPVAPFFGGTYSPPSQNHLMPFHGVKFQPSEACPRNFIICDQTDNRSQIMFHPTIHSKVCYPGLDFCFPSFKEDSAKVHKNVDGREASPLKENSDDIDALLNYDEEEEEESDDEVVSTARTSGNDSSDSFDSCSSHGSRTRKSRSPTFSHEPYGNDSNCCGRKRQKMKKTVKALKRIVPGGNQMNTVAVLDEAVRYLKSLKVEVETLGAGNIKPN